MAGYKPQFCDLDELPELVMAESALNDGHSVYGDAFPDR